MSYYVLDSASVFSCLICISLHVLDCGDLLLPRKWSVFKYWCLGEKHLGELLGLVMDIMSYFLALIRIQASIVFMLFLYKK